MHGAIGVLYAVIVVRIVWHMKDPQPRPIVNRPSLNRAARVVQRMMLVLITAQLLTGPVDIWSGGWAI